MKSNQIHKITKTLYRCAAEAHLVHYNSKYSGFEEASTQRDGLSVTGFLLKVTQVPNKSFEPLTNAVYEISKRNQSSTLSAGTYIKIYIYNKNTSW